jgi:hypothetical protein
MSSPILSAGLQQLYNNGLLPSNLSTSVLNGATPIQLNSLVKSTLASQEASTLFGSGSSSTDTANLSSTAVDSLTQAVDNSLSASGDSAAAKYLPNSSASPDTSAATSGSLINLLA